MTQARVIVTGSSGFIGTRLVRRLASQGTTVVALDIAPPRDRIDGVTYRMVDVREPIDPPIADGVSVIYNLAAIHRTPGHLPHEYYETNVLGALNVTALAKAAGVKTIVFTASIAVYGPSQALLDESSPPTPTSDYGRSKCMAEIIHSQWREEEPGRRLVIVRPGVVFGPGERGNYTHLAQALRRGYFFYPGRKDTIKSGGYVDELLKTLEFALARSEPDILYNFAYPDQSTTEDIVGAFAMVAGFGAWRPNMPLAPMVVAAGLFEFAAKFGLNTPIHRERIRKLVQSTRIWPGWLTANGYSWSTDLERALTTWRDETHGRFD